jgi:hypothetical protein
MRAKYFERELIHEFDDDGNVVRLQRMVFTAHELRAIALMLNGGLGVVGYGFTAKTIAKEFQHAWAETSGYSDAPD